MKKPVFRFYFNDGNQQLFEAENMYDALSHVLFVEKRYTATDIWKVEEVTNSSSVNEESTSTTEPTQKFIFSGFGYELWQDTRVPFGQWVVLDGEGECVAAFDSSLQAKQWMKAHKTSSHWMADGSWNWNKEAV